MDIQQKVMKATLLNTFYLFWSFWSFRTHMLEHGTEDSCLTVDVESEMLTVQKCKVDIIHHLFYNLN